MKTTTLYTALVLFTIGFVLINGYHNFLSVMFVLVLIGLFILLPLFLRIKYFIKDLTHPARIHGQWA